jgi:hypothetical protein
VNVVKLRWLSWLIALALWSASAPVLGAQIQPAQPENAAAATTDSPVLEKPLSLTPAAMQLAEQLGVADRIRRVEQLKVLPGSAASLELVQAKQAIMQSVLIGMLQVRATSAQITYDIFEAGQVQTRLEARRDRAVKYNSIANFVSGGVSEMAGGALQLVPNVKLDNAGNIVEMVGGALQTGLSAVALRQQEGPRRPTGVRPNMLAPIFDQSTNQESKYPRVVWQYLNSAERPGGETRRVALVKQWLETGRLEGRHAPLISSLSGLGGNRYPVTIDILEDRTAMLADVNAVVSRIDRLLLELLLYSEVQPET